MHPPPTPIPLTCLFCDGIHAYNYPHRTGERSPLNGGNCLPDGRQLGTPSAPCRRSSWRAPHGAPAWGDRGRAAPISASLLATRPHAAGHRLSLCSRRSSRRVPVARLVVLVLGRHSPAQCRPRPSQMPQRLNEHAATHTGGRGNEHEVGIAGIEHHDV